MISKTYPVTCHTDHVGHNSTFVAIKGYKRDGTRYIEQAISLGANKIVVDHSVDLKEYSQYEYSQYEDIKFEAVEDTRKALAQLSAEALGNPASKLKIIGITGTKGKTTTAFLTHHLLSEAGYKTAIFGTIKNQIINSELPSSLTTVESDTLQMLLAECVQRGVTHVVMEVSSHALSLSRVYGIEFEIVAFTNISSEHMDFYSSMDAYFEAKSKIFKQLKNKASLGKAIINLKDEFLAERLNLENVISPDYKALSNTLNGLEILIDGETIICPSMFGIFNASNISFAFYIAKEVGINIDKIKTGFLSFQGIPGRLQMHKLKSGALAFVDFAHNASSFEAVLSSLRPLTKHLIVVFGCGGDRDVTKRPVMGKIATTYGDDVIITSDNPRFEDTSKITSMIMDGVLCRARILIELDRKKAINKAANIARKGSIIALLGKGHECCNIIEGKKFDFSDYEEISIF